MLTKLFLQILNMSFTASFVIVIIVAARFLLKKAPRAISYALWGVALFRLLCPFSFESAVSLLPVKANPIPQGFVYQQLPRIETGIGFIDQSVNSVLPAATPAASMNPVQGLVAIGTFLWICGVAALAVYSVASLLALRRRLHGAVCQEGNIYLANGFASPFVMGVLRPKIYLPGNLTEDEKRYILLHEQTHIRRFDHAVKILGFAALCLHWFNPLVWAAFFLLGRDMEISCDEAVIKKLGSGAKKDYSYLLLTFATGGRIVGGSPLAFGEGDTKSRIKNVLGYKKPAFWVIAVTAVAVVAVGIGLMANPKENADARWGSSARDVLDRFSLALAASDIAGIRRLMPALNPPSRDVIENWKQFKISNVSLLEEDIRKDKAEFALLVDITSAPEGFGTVTSGTAEYYLYTERCDDGWYVESYGTDRRPQSDLARWWSQPNLIQPTKIPAPDAAALWNARTAYVGDNAAVGKLLGLLPLPQGLKHNHFELYTDGEQRGLQWTLDEAENAGYNPNELNQDALLLFALIDNLEDFYVETKDPFGGGTELHYDRQWADRQAGGDVRAYAKDAEALQKLIGMSAPAV